MRTQKSLLRAIAIAAMLCVPTSYAALNAYLTITGDTQGEFEGGSTQAGREGQIIVFGVEHELYSARDAASGLPTGRRQHSALKIVKEVDKASPLLYNALVNNENLSTVVLRFYRPSRTGQEVNHYTITLENASVASVRLWQANNKDPDAVSLPQQEEVQFTYQKITWTYEDGGITAEDDWETPVN